MSKTASSYHTYIHIARGTLRRKGEEKLTAYVHIKKKKREAGEVEVGVGGKGGTKLLEYICYTA